MKTKMTLGRFFAPSPRRRVTVLCAVCLIGLTVSCSGDSISTPDVGGSLFIEQLTPVSFTATAGSVLPDAPLIRVTDARTGKPVAGASVQFVPSRGAGSIERFNAVTDESGFASPGKWEMSTGTGIKSLKAIVNDIRSVFLYVTVTADVPASIQHVSQPTIGVAGETVDAPLVVVRDRFGNGVTNIPVTFRVAQGGGDVLPETATTNTFGSVATRVRLGPAGGDNVIVATVFGVEPDTFVVAALDPARVSHYLLESVRLGNVVTTAAAAGLSSGALTISNFDPCLCRKENGYFIIEAVFTLQPTFEIPRRIGKFNIDPPRMIIEAGDANRINLVDGLIEIEIVRDNMDWRWEETWIFRKFP